jgi:hypothetical protein
VGRVPQADRLPDLALPPRHGTQSRRRAFSLPAADDGRASHTIFGRRPLGQRARASVGSSDHRRRRVCRTSRDPPGDASRRPRRGAGCWLRTTMAPSAGADIEQPDCVAGGVAGPSSSHQAHMPGWVSRWGRGSARPHSGRSRDVRPREETALCRGVQSGPTTCTAAAPRPASSQAAHHGLGEPGRP